MVLAESAVGAEGFRISIYRYKHVHCSVDLAFLGLNVWERTGVRVWGEEEESLLSLKSSGVMLILLRIPLFVLGGRAVSV